MKPRCGRYHCVGIGCSGIAVVTSLVLLLICLITHYMGALV